LRRAAIETLIDVARIDRRVVLVTADLGYMVVEPFAKAFPDRFFNVGVAEQNMVGVATGLAESGFLPFCYSIAPFAVLRPYEFIRNGPVMHQLPVRILGIGGGVAYGTNGATHYALEDVGILRLQPGMKVICPADHQQTRTALRTTWNAPGPAYYRLGKDDEAVIPGLDGRFDLGRLQHIRSGADFAFVALGHVAKEAVEASARLKERGIESSVAVVASVSPAPVDDLVDLLESHALVITVEAHYTTGGLGSLVSEVVAERGIACKVIRCGVSRLPDGRTGSEAWLHDVHGISADALVARATAALEAQGSVPVRAVR
jgi:transketolase